MPIESISFWVRSDDYELFLRKRDSIRARIRDLIREEMIKDV